MSRFELVRLVLQFFDYYVHYKQSDDVYLKAFQGSFVTMFKAAHTIAYTYTHLLVGKRKEEREIFERSERKLRLLETFLTQNLVAQVQ